MVLRLSLLYVDRDLSGCGQSVPERITSSQFYVMSSVGTGN